MQLKTQYKTQNLPYLGDGICSTVYDLGDGRVLKHGKFLDGTYHYLKWVVSTIAWRRHSACPRVYALESDGTEYWVIMEKLSPLDDDAKRKWRDDDKRWHYESLRYNHTPPQDSAVDYMICDFLYEVGLKSGSGVDMHADNVMLRGDGSLVATDPFF